VTKTDGL